MNKDYAWVATHRSRLDGSDAALLDQLNAVGLFENEDGVPFLSLVKDWAEMPKMVDVETAEQARDAAIGWQHAFGEQDWFQSELHEWQTYFESLVERFPELADEFRENGII